MRNSGTFAVALLVAVMGLSSCAEQPGTMTAYDGYSNRCSSSFVSEYNSLISEVRYATTVTSLNSAKSSIASFRAKYANVSCVAVTQSTSATTTVDVNSKMTELSNSVESQLVLNQLNP